MNKTPADKWGTPIKYDLSGVEQLRKLRGVKTFADFPQSTRGVYLQVAKCFPGWQVWAVGSRVRGCYICILSFQELGMNYGESWIEYERTKQARLAAGMKDKGQSDYDFLVAPDAIQIGQLPKGAERVRVLVPKDERIPIPIFENGMELG